jgi:very-short-patch-repair endonuclease
MDHMTTSDLRTLGWTPRRIAQAVATGELIRVRRGHYSTPGTADPVMRAVRVGGRLGCVSELRYRKVWVLDDDVLHVQLDEHTSDLHDPDSGDAGVRGRSDIRLHWHDPAADGTPGHVSALDALADASRCLERRAWIASVDSAIRLGELPRTAVTALGVRVNAASRADLGWVDARAESGLESVVRVLARDLGFRVRSQVWFRGVGRVDLVVEDWIVVEADGTAFHDVAVSPRDRRRDALLAAMNRTVLRPGYSLIVHEPSVVARQLIGAVANHRCVRGSGELAACARIRARRLGIP